MAQFIANGLVSAAVYLLVGLALLIVFFACRRLDFSIAALIALAPYTVLASREWLSFEGGIVAGILAAVGFAALEQGIVFHHLSRRTPTHVGTGLPELLASLGIFVVVQNALSVCFGDNRLSIRMWPVVEGMAFFGAKLTEAQVLTCAVSLLCWIGVWLFGKCSQIGCQVRALSNDEGLAMATGFKVDMIRLGAVALSSLLAAIAGILMACDTDITPGMGLAPLVMGLVALVVGGASLGGIACGALLLALARHLSVFWLPAQWQDAVAFVILVGFLALRPYGFAGQPLRKARV